MFQGAGIEHSGLLGHLNRAAIKRMLSYILKIPVGKLQNNFSIGPTHVAVTNSCPEDSDLLNGSGRCIGTRTLL